MTKTPSN